MTDQIDTVDYLSQKLSEILLHNQELDFSKLRALALLNGDKENKRTYLELIVLSFIKYLKLSATFNLEIKQDNLAYRIFNSMNLNDDLINTHFCIFLSIVAPDVINSLCMVTSKLASDLASYNSTKYSYSRMQKLEDSLNSIELKDKNEFDDDFAISTSLGVRKQESPVMKRPKKISLMKAFAVAAYLPEEMETTRRKRRQSSNKQSSASSDNNFSLEQYVSTNRLPNSQFNKSKVGKDHAESASDTARRLYKKRSNSTIRTFKSAVLSPNDSASAVLPSREEISAAKAKYQVDNDESSVDI